MKAKNLLLGSLVLGSGLALTLLACRKPARTKQVSRDSYDAIDAYVKGEMRRLKIPGAALAIVEGDEIVHLRGFGYARPGGQAPTPQTPFVLGSTTKSFTALAVMQLVEAGKIDLNAPVRRYLPWFCVADPRASAQMTVRHLMNQTSGLPMLPGMTVLADLDESAGAAERQARGLSTLQITRPVGAAFEYSNLNYNLLGMVIQAAGGESYEDYVQKHIFAPLDMSHTYTSPITAKQNGLAVGHRYWFASPYPVTHLALPRGSLSSGQLISTTEDMAHYLIAYLNGGRYRDIQILSPEGVAQLHRGVAEIKVMGKSVGTYGMGWFVEKIGPMKLVWHGGNVPDFSSYMALLPEQRKGIVLLVNADHYGLPIILMEVGLGLSNLLAGREPPPIQLGYIPAVMRALLLIPLLQFAGVVTTLQLLRDWDRDPARRPNRGRRWGLDVLLPLLPNLALAAIPVFLRVRGMLPYLKFYNPDVYWVALICGGFAGIWSFLRTGLILRALRKSKA